MLLNKIWGIKKTLKINLSVFKNLKVAFAYSFINFIEPTTLFDIYFNI